MITRLTDQFLIIRDKYSQIKKELMRFLLFFVNASEPDGSCVLCSSELKKTCSHASHRHGQVQTTVECTSDDRLCKLCVEMLHSKSYLFCLKMSVPEEYLEVQQFADGICGIGSNFYAGAEKLIRRRSKIEHINEMFSLLNDGSGEKTPPVGQDAFDHPSLDSSLVVNFKEKLKSEKIKRLIKNQMQSKIRVFEEQLDSLRRSYAEAMMSGRFDDSNALKSAFLEIFESKIRLEEKLARYKVTS